MCLSKLFERGRPFLHTQLQPTAKTDHLRLSMARCLATEGKKKKKKKKKTFRLSVDLAVAKGRQFGAAHHARLAFVVTVYEAL